MNCLVFAFCMFVSPTSDCDFIQTDKPLPWLAEAPGEFIRLIDIGNVTILVDDERIRQAGKTALTVFHFGVEFDFKFRHQNLRFDSLSKTWQLTLVAWMEHPKITLNHKIYIQSTFKPVSPWESKLLRHEFDHVAVSTDPRLLKMIKRTFQQRRQWIATWQQALAPTEQEIRIEIQKRFQAEVEMQEKMVQAQYDCLDKESYEGTNAIADRMNFFTELYSIAGLDRCKYTMDDSMRDFVKERLSAPSSLKEVERHYLFVMP